MAASTMEERALENEPRPKAAAPAVSIVIPVFNEELNLEPLYARLAPVMDGIAGSVEAIFVDDGSADRSLEILRGLERKDYGCMLRAYTREVTDCMRRCEEKASFIPALACQFARRIAEVPVGHADRAAGESKYSFWKLLKLQADLITGFTTAPLRLL